MDKSVSELEARIKREWNDSVTLFNPTSKDFSYKYDQDTYTALALDTVQVPIPISKVIEKHLITHVLNVRDLSHKQSNRDKVAKEVEMNDDKG